LLVNWELAHGLNLLHPRDALADADHDGQSNLAESLAGTSRFYCLRIQHWPAHLP
jgi:hypothetical protein